MSEYPSKEEYTEETLRSDGGDALKKSRRMSSKDMDMAVKMLPKVSKQLRAKLPLDPLGSAGISAGGARAAAKKAAKMFKSAKKRKGPR